MIKGSIKQELMIVNVYVPNARTHDCLNQLLMDLKGDIDSNNNEL